MKRKHVGILIIGSAGLFLCKFTPLVTIVYHLAMYAMAAHIVYPPDEGLHTFRLEINGRQVVGIADGDTLRFAVAPFGYTPILGVHPGLLWVEAEATAVEEDGCFKVLTVSEAADSSLDGHDFAVHAFGNGVGDSVSAIAHDILQTLLD